MPKSNIQRRIERTTGVSTTVRRVNAGRATPGRQSGFGTKMQKRDDLVAAFGGD